MKKSILLLLLMLSVTLVFAEYENLVAHTATIDSLTLHSIRDACHPNDSHANYAPIMRQWWCHYLAIPDTLERYEETDVRSETFGTNDYLKEALWGDWS